MRDAQVPRLPHASLPVVLLPVGNCLMFKAKTLAEVEETFADRHAVPFATMKVR